MGKSPGRWIKTLIFGKKSSRSKNPKAHAEKIGDGKGPVPLYQIGNTNLSFSASQRIEGKIEESLQSDNAQDEVRTPGLPNHGISITTTELNAQNDSDRIREEQAATDVQAALRGNLARREFRTLKGIVRLQALIRGHLVRRQAISTLYCMFRLVKFQALTRGRKIRHSDIGVEVQKRCSKVTELVMCSVGVVPSTHILKLSSNGFARKILDSSPSAMALHFQYDHNEPNSVLSWLGRWSTSHFWQVLPEPNPELQKPDTHRSLVTNVDSIASEFDKPIRNIRKLSPANFVEEDPELVLERVKRNLRKVHHPVLENTVETETETETETQKKSTNDNTRMIKLELSESERTPEQAGVSEARRVTTKEKVIEGENIPLRKERRVSLPVMKQMVPSYMAPTESANAKVRGQNESRRHSLPDAKSSVSPTGKFKKDTSLQLSRDGNVKVNQVEWV